VVAPDVSMDMARMEVASVVALAQEMPMAESMGRARLAVTRVVALNVAQEVTRVESVGKPTTGHRSCVHPPTGPKPTMPTPQPKPTKPKPTEPEPTKPKPKPSNADSAAEADDAAVI
jgi:outer membrane biosynthesis protein TonB